MSYDVPPSQPPSGPPETLDFGGGRPVPPTGGRRRGWLVGVGAVALVAVGGASWAAWSFLSTGAQPAEALPDTTIAYVSIDLDPSGGQKIEALQTLQKFPAFDERVGLDPDDDVRAWIFEELQGVAGCENLDYADDIEPWLGDRFAVAAVDTGGKMPAPVYVLQVSDASAAEDGFAAIRDCAGGGGDNGAWTIDGDWALIAEEQETVDAVADATAEGTLAADDDFQQWTGEAGDPGIVSLYAAPGAGTFLAEVFREFALTPGDADFTTARECSVDTETGDRLCEEHAYSASHASISEPDLDLVPDETLEALEDFGGAASTLRFDDGGLELEVAGDAGDASDVTSGVRAGDAVASLPEGTVAALGLSLGDAWFDRLLEQIAVATGQSTEELVAEAEGELGIELPEDAEKLVGEAFALALGPDFEFESFLADSPQGEIGVKVLGDPDGIEGVLDQLRTAAAGADEGILDSDVGDDAVAIGPDADFRKALLSDGGLGDSDAYNDVVEGSDDAATVLYVDFDAADGWLVELAGDEAEVRDNLEPLRALGVSTWLDGDMTRAVFKVTTD